MGRKKEKFAVIEDGLSDGHSYRYPALDSDLRKKIKALKAVITHLEANFITPANTEFSSSLKIDYASALNLQQLTAVKMTQGKVLVIAGAGSGKTKTLTYRTSYLLETGVRPEQCLILTFTKKAATEIKHRVNTLLGGHATRYMTTGTFHSFCNMLLARYAKVLGIHPQFTILDTEDSADLIALLRKQLNTTEYKGTAFPKKNIIYALFSASRNRLIPLPQLIEQERPEAAEYVSDLVQLNHLYTRYKRERHLYDYDDLIEEVNQHLASNAEFKNIIQTKYRYIMVDEYQDTNIPQKQLVDHLAERDDCSLMVVGDDNQSIYAFRGANYQNILRFGQSYQDAKLIKLEENYRSTPNILGFINNVSDQVSLGYKKKLFSNEKSLGPKPEFIRCSTNEQEAEWITQTIVQSYERLDYNDMAILCRTSFHSNFVQAELMRRRIPFNVVGGIKFIEKRHIKDILAYLKIIWNPFDAISWHRVLTLLPGVGNVTATRIAESVQQAEGELDNLMDSKYAKRNPEIIRLYETLLLAEQGSDLVDKFHVIEDYYVPLLQKLEDNWKTRIEDFTVLRRLCGDYGELAKFLSNLMIDPPNETSAVFTGAEPETDAVTVSTIHSAKGLEWNTVFVMSLIDGAVPHYRSFDDFEQLEEERKLFYVACSRAKENLYLTAPAYFSTYAAYFDAPSRFITEVDANKYIYKESTSHFGY